MSMTVEESNEFQTYLQMYDKGLVSKKTVLAKVGIDWEKEKKEIEKDIAFDAKAFSRPPKGSGGECCC